MDPIFESYKQVAESYKIRKPRNAPVELRIKDLKEPYRMIALQRAKEGGVKTNLPLENLYLDDAFVWRETPEGYKWWDKVGKGQTPRVKDSSLPNMTTFKTRILPH